MYCENTIFHGGSIFVESFINEFTSQTNNDVLTRGPQGHISSTWVQCATFLTDCFSYRPKKHQFGRGHWDLSSCQVSLQAVQRFQRRSRKCLSQSEARAAILFPVKFHQIPFSSFRGEVENVSANQKQGWPSCFSDRPKKHKLGRGRWDLSSCQVLLNSVQRF